MRTSLFLLLPVSLLALSGLGACANSVEDCERNPTLECFLTSGGGNGTGAQNTGGGTGTAGAGGNGAGTMGGGGLGGDNTGGMVPASCDPSTSDFTLGLGDEVPDACNGIFVKGGITGGSGTKADPYGDLAQAIGAADMSTPIYVCSGATLSATVVINKDVTIIGGFDCAWKRDEVLSPIESDSLSLPVLTISGGNTDVKLVELAITALDADTEGQSSIGVVVDAATVLIHKTSITAGNGFKGVDGAPEVGTGTAGANGENGANGCAMAGALGGPGGDSSCDGQSTAGGSGGNGSNQTVGQMGSPGSGGAAGGTGEVQNGAVAMTGVAGAIGNEGLPGTLGLGLGLLSVSGYDPPSANEDATKGSRGQGGGGGGGASECQLNSSLAGPGGGGGGGGGCGGAPGHGGQGGGASFALVVLDVGKVTLEFAALASASGGTGGAGSDGQLGGVGGMKGVAGLQGGGIAIAADGGPGGRGGRGGPGAGGAGGPTAAIAVGVGAAKPADDPNSSLQTVGNGGTGGPGAINGTMDSNDAPQGQGGVKCLVLSFDTGTCL